MRLSGTQPCITTALMPNLFDRHVIDQSRIDLLDAGDFGRFPRPTGRSSTLVNRCLAPRCWTTMAIFCFDRWTETTPRNLLE